MAKLLIVTKSIPQGHVVQDVVDFPHVSYAEGVVSMFERVTQSVHDTGVQVTVFRLYNPDKRVDSNQQRYDPLFDTPRR